MSWVESRVELRSGRTRVEQRGEGPILRSLDPRALWRVLRGAAGSDLPKRERLEKREIPTLLLPVRGDPGHPHSSSSAEALAGSLPGARLEPMADRCALPSIADFLASLPA